MKVSQNQLIFVVKMIELEAQMCLQTKLFGIQLTISNVSSKIILTLYFRECSVNGFSYISHSFSLGLKLDVVRCFCSRDSSCVGVVSGLVCRRPIR